MKSTILVLTSTFPRNEQDHEPRFVADLCQSLISEYNIVVVTQRRPGASLDENYHGLRVKRFRYAPRKWEVLSETGGIANTLSQKPWTWFLVPLFLIAQIRAVNREIKKSSPHLIHCHWLIPQTLSAIAARLFRKNHIPIVTTSHGADIYGLNGKILRTIKKRAINASDVFCVVSNAMKNHVSTTLNINNRKITVSPMGANLLSMFTPGNPARIIPRQILFVGRLVKKKGVEHLLTALKKLNRNGYEFTLIIVGYGPEQHALQTLSKNLAIDQKITFTGSLSHSEVANYFRSSEVCVFPFVQADDGDIEGLGLVVVEAMGCKCPIIVGDVPAASDLVTDGFTGLVCDPKTTQALCSCILKLHEDAPYRTQLIDNAFEQVHKKYTWEACANRYIQIFNSFPLS